MKHSFEKEIKDSEQRINKTKKMKEIKDIILGLLMLMIPVVILIFLNFILSKSLFLGGLLICFIGLLILYDCFSKGGRDGGIGPDMDNPIS
jgi:putative Mn2+ efflux pump MntP